MLKKFTFLTLTMSIIPAFSMEVRQWVKAATQVKIESLKLNQAISINDNTTVLDVKNILLNNEGIAVNQQALYPRWKNPWHLWLTDDHGPALPNDLNVKEVMNTYNTNRLALLLTNQEN